MSRITRQLAALALASACLPAVAASPLTFVASDGSDANPCTLASPCRTFQAAHDAVDPGGEVVALDSADFGVLAINKSVTVMSAPGAFAGIGVTSGVGVSIAASNVTVALRGLSITDAGSGTGGISMTVDSSLSIENCVVSNFNFGVQVVGTGRLKLVDTVLRNNNTGLALTKGATADVSGSKFLGVAPGGGFGISVDSAPGTITSVSVVDSVASHNFSGFVATALGGGTSRLSCLRCTASNNVQMGFFNVSSAGATAQMLVGSSLASYNGQFGFSNSPLGGTATFQSLGNNALHENTSGPTSGTITTSAGF